MPFTPIIPMSSSFLTGPARRYRSIKSYDRKGRRTLGYVYARHLPERHLLIDFAEFVRYARQSYSEAVARAIVVAYLESYPSSPFLFRGKPVRLLFPSWDRLGHEAHWYFYLRAMVASPRPITHAVTINFSDDLIQITGMRDRRGPAWLVGQLVNRKLWPLYHRAGLPLTYGYAVELHRKPDPEFVKYRRAWLDSYDATLLLHVPHPILERVEQALAKWAGADVQRIRRRLSGAAVHIQVVQDRKCFLRGGDNTLRLGVEGIGDYAAKSFPRLHALREHYGRHDAPFAKQLERLIHASDDIRNDARAVYEGLRKLAGSTWADVAADLRRGSCSPEPGTISIGQPLRIWESDPLLMAAVERFRSEADLRAALVAKGWI
jgi:hypothetical protein